MRIVPECRHCVLLMHRVASYDSRQVYECPNCEDKITLVEMEE